MRIFLSLCLSLLFLGAKAQPQTALPAAQSQDETPSAAPATTESHSAIDPAKEADIRRLLDITRAGALAAEGMDAQEKNIRPLLEASFPAGEYRDRLIDLFFAKMRARRNTGALISLIIPAYDKYYSREDIQQLIKIYQTPLGQKMIAVTPKILLESQDVTRSWGESLGRESMREVLAEHPELEKAIEDAKGSP